MVPTKYPFSDFIRLMPNIVHLILYFKILNSLNMNNYDNGLHIVKCPLLVFY